MKLNRLGKSAIQVSEVSFGCMSLKAERSDTDQVIGKALDLGINFFDTADLYEFGKNEELLGKALQKKRKDVVIATKVGNEWGPDIEGWNWTPTKEYILKAIDASLQRLNTDYIDLFQLHGGTIDDPIDETIEAFELLREQGKIREYGISSIRPNVIREYAKRSNIVSVMMQYSLLDRRPEESCLSLLNENSISVITRGSLAKGLLAGKEATSYLSFDEKTVSKALSRLRQIAKDTSQNLAQIAAKYVLQSPTVASAVVGFRTATQVDNVMNSFNDGSLSPSGYNKLAREFPVSTYKSHRYFQ